MQSLKRGGYTADEVKAALHAPIRTLDFRYELLDTSNVWKRNLNNVLAASISYNSMADIKRSAKITMLDTQDINLLTDRVKMYARLQMPDGGWVEFPLGVFLLSTPPRKSEVAGVVTRDIEAYDLTQILMDDKVADRYLVTNGTNYIYKVETLLSEAGIYNYNLTPTDKYLPAIAEWKPGTSKLKIINDLLAAINYRPLFFDEDGNANAAPYVSPQDRASEYTYKDDSLSVIFPNVEQHIDLFDVPNKWVLVVSEPDRDPLVSTYINSNANSMTSTVTRGRTIVDYREQQDAADQATLDDLCKRIAFEASQVYERVTFETAIMPMHSDFDVYTLEFSRLGISEKYTEMEWSFQLKAGAKMKHVIRRVVDI